MDERVRVRLEPAAISLLNDGPYWRFMKVEPPHDALAVLRLVPVKALHGRLPIELHCRRGHAEVIAAWCEAQAASMDQEPEERERTSGRLLDRTAAAFRKALQPQ